KEIVECKTLFATAVEPTRPEDQEIARAKVYEAKLGLTYNLLSVAGRQLGGFYHPRSRISEAGYVNLLHAYNEVLEFWDREFSTRHFTLVINGIREVS